MARDHVIKPLLDGHDRRVVVVAAPAGYGKTTAVAQWAALDDRPFAWLSLGPTDDDPVHLVRHVGAALDAIEALPPDVAWFLAAQGQPVDDLLGAIQAELGRRGPLVLVLDDVHLVADRVLRPVASRLIEALSVDSQLVLISRRDDPVPLARLRMEDDLVEVGPALLAMDEPEARALFDRAGVDVDGDQVASLVARTEGWPGGLHLAALASAPSAGGIAAFGGRTRAVADYLVEQVLEQLPPEATQFLERSSVLETFTAADLDDLLETDDAARRLEEIERTGNLFLVPLDDERRWYRYHHLFAELLRARLEQHDPVRARALHGRASLQHERRGDTDGAVRHAIAAGDDERAGALMVGSAAPLTLTGRSAVLERWLDLLGRDRCERLPAALVCRAWLGLALSDPDMVHAACTAALGADTGAPLAPGSDSVEVAVSVLRAIVASDGLVGVVRHTDVARAAGPPATNRWWALATALQGTARAMTGDLVAARACFLEALPHLGQAPAIEAGLLAHLALLDFDEGERASAQLRSDQSLRLVEQHNLGAMAVTVPAFAIGALVQADAGNAADARAHMATATRLLDGLSESVARSKLFCHLVLARAAMVLDDRSAAGFHVARATHAQVLEPHATALNERLAALRDQLSSGQDLRPLGGETLTTAELRVLRLLPTHLSLQEIADELFVSRNTAKTHSVAIYRKLGVSGRSEAVEAARQSGLLPR